MKAQDVPQNIIVNVEESKSWIKELLDLVFQAPIPVQIVFIICLLILAIVVLKWRFGSGKSPAKRS